ncbi:MAG: hypothetical protein D6765_07220 [Bacteroidetes bacterium]|nr:MAG: hypothetical protein D6765_07220 [Bacteroidota bacterium]
MKLRILGNSLRLRLTQSETQAIGRGEAVSDSVSFPGEKRLTYALEPSDSPQLDARFEGERIVVRVPRKEAAVWATGEGVSLEGSCPLPEGATLRILVEKDFRCLKERPAEDESDLFPHPDAESQSC